VEELLGLLDLIIRRFFSPSSAEKSRFYASPYSLFGKTPMEAPEHSGLLEDGGVDGGDYGGFGGPDDGGYQFSSMGDEVWFSAPSCLAQPASVFA
jgi:hypothetical protein